MTPTVLWHTYPLGLLGADQTGVDRRCRRSLRTLADWLPHVASVGADGLLLGPVFASISHGYDTVTHRRIDERLGSADDVDAVVAAAAEHGVGVVLDGAFAYASRAFWRLADPAETEDPWFARHGGDLVPWQRVDALVTPDFASVGYQTYVADTMVQWLDRGVAGWRLDSAWSVPVSFWRKVLARVRETHPQAWFLAQVFDDDLPPVVNRAGFSCATEYALMHSVRGWLSGGPPEEMVAALRRHQRNSTPHTFLGNHDFTRLADALPPAALPAAFALVLTLPGVPGIYYGDEIGVVSRWAHGGADALLRPPMTPADVPVPDDEEPDLLAVVRRLGAFRRAHPWIGRGVLAEIDTHDGALSYTVVDGADAVRVCVNGGGAPVRLADHGLPEPAVVGSAEDCPATGELPPHGWAISVFTSGSPAVTRGDALMT